jgi:hypothetical protein
MYFRGYGLFMFLRQGDACSAHLARQLSLTNALPLPDRVGGNRAGLRRVDAATVLQPEPDASGQIRKVTAQETAKTA